MHEISNEQFKSLCQFIQIKASPSLIYNFSHTCWIKYVCPIKGLIVYDKNLVSWLRDSLLLKQMPKKQTEFILLIKLKQITLSISS